MAYLQLTRRCNQTCLFCSNPPNGRLIPLRRAKAWIDRFAKRGYKGLILTGGEPTLHTDLHKIVGYARKKKIAPRMITNGQNTAKPGVLKRLYEAGLDHMHVSVYSDRPEVQANLTGKKDSLECIMKTLDEAGRLGVRVDINTVINHYNADHLSKIVSWIMKRWPFIGHFVWNNMDPQMNRAADNPDTIPKLREFELELHRAMSLLHASGRTFRAERVPLCFMTDFAQVSTETRKIVKSEGRAIYFLDEKGIKIQDQRGFWAYSKAECCKVCSLSLICAGLYEMDVYYSSQELCPVFVSRDAIIRRILPIAGGNGGG